MISALKEKLLHSLYQEYESFVGSYSFACRKGCSSCCTQSVNITGLEGKTILRYLREHCEGNNFERLASKLAATSSLSPTCSTNQFALHCIQGKEIVEAVDAWSFEPCIFLHENICSIYPVRPFVCRSFASTVCCEGEKTAQLSTAFISLNNTVMQVVEHIDQGNIWGNMNTVLVQLQDKAQSNPERVEDSGLLRSLPCPGFLIPPEDEKSVLSFIQTLYGREVEGKPFGKWISAEM